MNIVVLTELPVDNATFYLRLGFFLDHLKKIGLIDVFNINDLKNLSEYDLIIVQRFLWLKPELIAAVEKYTGPVVFEADDLLPHLPSYSPDHFHIGSVRLFWRLFQDRFSAGLVSTKILKQYMQSVVNQIVVTKNVLPERFSLQRRLKAVNGQLNLAFLGTPTHLKDLSFLTNLLNLLGKRYQDRLAFHYFGYAPERIAEQRNVTIHSFEFDYIKSLSRIKKIGIDIGIAPLVNNRFNRAKSSIKYLEYTLAGGAGVYSKVTPYFDIKGGELVTNSEAIWNKVLCQWIEDPAKIDVEFCKARDHIKKEYRFETECEKFYELIRSVYQKHKPRKILFPVCSTPFLRNLETMNPIEGFELISFFQDSIAADKKLTEMAGRFLWSFKYDKHNFLIRKYALCDYLGLITDKEQLQYFFRLFLKAAYLPDHRFESTLYNLASRLKTSELNQESERLFKRTIARSQRSNLLAGAFFHLGEIAFKSGRLRRAVNLFKKCLQANPGHRQAAVYIEQLKSSKTAVIL